MALSTNQHAAKAISSAMEDWVRAQSSNLQRTTTCPTCKGSGVITEAAHAFGSVYCRCEAGAIQVRDLLPISWLHVAIGLSMVAIILLSCSV